ncbi:MAG: ATP-binding protein [Proteobacteria bacterium]|nr:ATP-binding protein [Pseudomonadota bacterium]
MKTKYKAIQNNSSTLDHGHVVVGKDVLELLSSAMYVDQLTIYREYIQNSIDSIDEARSSRLLDSKINGKIEINLETDTRSITIKDNGMGIKSDDFYKRVTSIGASHKKGTNARGFRGVGRLSGLGCCRELVFRTKFYGEEIISELRWDCQKLKANLRDNTNNMELEAVIHDSTSFNTYESKDKNAHYFEVQLNGVMRLRKDSLINEDSITNYISQIAPIPFSPEFSWADDIKSSLDEYNCLSDVDIFINNADAPLYRPHRDAFNLSDSKNINFQNLDIYKIPSIDGEMAAIGWVLHHEYTGALSTSLGIKGMRARAGNIQVGGNNILENIFPELRFNSWAVSELHILDKNIIPNGRRDNFEQNAHFNNLINQLLPMGRDISNKCRSSSLIRNKVKLFESKHESISDNLKIIEKGILPKKDTKRLEEVILTNIVEMEGAISYDLLDKKTKRRLNTKFNKLKNKIDSKNKRTLKGSPEELSFLSINERKTYQNIFSMVYEFSSNRTVADRLINKIIRRIKIDKKINYPAAS